MDWKSTVLISGAGLLATWFVSMPEIPPPTGNQVAAEARAPQVSAAAIDIQREAARLQVRLHPDSHAVATSRNPFRFASSPREATAPDTAATIDAASVAVPSAIPRPQLSLDGIATEIVDGQEQRTAILHTDAGVVLVKEGDVVAGQYKVITIAPDSAELTNVSDGSMLRITLR